MTLLARLLLDLGRVEQGGNDRGRSDTDRNAGLHQFLTALLTGAVGFVIAVISHDRSSIARANA